MKLFRVVFKDSTGKPIMSWLAAESFGVLIANIGSYMTANNLTSIECVEFKGNVTTISAG